MKYRIKEVDGKFYPEYKTLLFWESMTYHSTTGGNPIIIHYINYNNALKQIKDFERILIENKLKPKSKTIYHKVVL